MIHNIDRVGFCVKIGMHATNQTRNCSNFTRIRIRLLLEYQNNQIEWGSKMYMNIEYSVQLHDTEL